MHLAGIMPLSEMPCSAWFWFINTKSMCTFLAPLAWLEYFQALFWCMNSAAVSQCIYMRKIVIDITACIKSSML